MINLNSEGSEIPSYLTNQPAISHIITALFISSPALFWISCRPTRVYDIVTEVDEFGYSLNEIHSCFDSTDSSLRVFLMLHVVIQYIMMAAYSWVTKRHSSLNEVVDINRCYFFRLGTLATSVVFFFYKEGLLGENGKLQWLVDQSGMARGIGFILACVCVISPPSIFILCPILKRCFAELASSQTN